MDGSAVLDANGELRAVLLPCLHNSALGALLWFAVPIESLLDAVWNSPARQALTTLSCPRISSTAAEAGGAQQTTNMNTPPMENLQSVNDQRTAKYSHYVALEQHPQSASRSPCSIRHPAAQHILEACVQQASYRERLESAQRAVVLVKLSSGWGSGVVVDTKLGIVLTNAHLFEHRGLQDLPSPTSAAHTKSTRGEDIAGPSYSTQPHMGGMTAGRMWSASGVIARAECKSLRPDSLASTQLWRQECQVLNSK